MLRNVPETLLIAALVASCGDTTISVGDALETEHKRDDLALAQMANETEGVWHGTVPSLWGVGEMPVALTFAPAKEVGPRTVAFGLRCTTGNCPAAEISSKLLGTPPPTEGTGSASQFVSGTFELLTAHPDETGMGADAIMFWVSTQGEKLPAIPGYLWLSDAGDELQLRFNEVVVDCVRRSADAEPEADD